MAALAEDQKLVDVYQEPDEQQARRLIAQGYEISRSQTERVADEVVEWTDRVLVIYSPSLADRAYRGLQGRLQRAEEKLVALTPAPARGQPQYEELAPLPAQVEAILQQRRVAELLQVTYERQVSQRQVRQYKDRPARAEEKVRYQLHLSRNEVAIEAQFRTMG